MAGDGLINKIPSPHRTLELMWALPPIRLGHKLSMYDHEKRCGDVYVAIKLSGQLQEWEWRKDNKKILHDRRGIFMQARFRLEEEVADKSIEVIEEKIRRYIKLSIETREWEYVIFDMPTQERANEVFEVLPKYKRGNQFLVTLHDYLSRHPLTNIFASPLEPDRLLTWQEIIQPSVQTDIQAAGYAH